MNEMIKGKIRESRVRQYEIAEYLGIDEGNFSKWFRKPLTEEKETQIIEAIKAIREREKL